MNYLENQRQYEQAEKLELDEAVITDNEIRIVSGSTCLCSCVRKTTHDLKDYENCIKELKQIAKQNSVRLKGINKLTKRIQEGYVDYVIAMDKYHKDFDLLVVLWERNVNDLRVGLSNNMILNEIIHPLKFKIESYYYQDKINCEFDNIYRNLVQAKERLKRDKGYTMMNFS